MTRTFSQPLETRDFPLCCVLCERGRFSHPKSTGINSTQMRDSITLQTFATNADGFKILISEVDDYSVYKYISRQLPTVSKSTTAQNKALAKLLVSLANYGAKSQIYADYRTSELANEGLDEYQSLVDYSDITYNKVTGKEGPVEIKWYPSPVLGNTIKANISIPKSQIAENGGENAYLVVKYKTGTGKDMEATYSYNDFVTNTVSGTECWKVTFENIESRTIGTAFTVSLMNGTSSTPVNTLTYSIESYCAGYKTATGKTADVTKAMTVYGQNAVAYFALV